MGPVQQQQLQQPQEPQFNNNNNMKSILAIVFVNYIAARPDHGGVHQAMIHHSDPHHAVHHHQPVHHAVHHHQSVHHAVHQVAAHNSVDPHSVDMIKSVPPTIAELVVSNSRFSTLLAAVKAAGLVDTLSGPGPFTVFAPTNVAFEKVPKEALTSLLGNKDELAKVLLRHVVPTAIQGKNIPPGTTELETAGGEKIAVTRDESNLIQIQSSAGSAYVVLFDVIASNGVVHAVDTVF